MDNKIDLNKSVYELVKEYPEVVNIMKELGFTEITNKAMLNSVGKVVTITKGAKIKNIPLEKIIEAFEKNGYVVSGGEKSNIKSVAENQEKIDADSRVAKIKELLKRLSDAESLESVQGEFVREFKEIDPAEIMKAEQQLIREGTKIEDMKELCDLHSALFHYECSSNRNKVEHDKEYFEERSKDAVEFKRGKVEELVSTKGHPLNTLSRENEKLQQLIGLAKNKSVEDLDLSSLSDISIHYAKKGDLLYPLLATKYEITGPSNVMWTVDDEIRDEFRAVVSSDTIDLEKVNKVLKRMEEMIYKEEKILFPICAVNFSNDEWIGVYKDSKDYGTCFGVEGFTWDEGEAYRGNADVNSSFEEEIVMPGGHLKLDELIAVLNTIPMEITFVDVDNFNRFFNEGEKMFKRPIMAIDREVFSCHPPKIEPMVRSIINDFRNGHKDKVEIWMEKMGRTFLVKYMAVRDKSGKYLGTMELVQDMEFAKEHFLANK